MNKTFDIDLYDGHLIFICDGMRVLVDTGCPVTIGKENSFKFMGNEYVCHTSFGGKDINGISRLMNYDIDFFMGMDIVEKYYIQTNYKRKVITFSTEVLPFDHFISLPIIRGCMGEVCIDLIVKEQLVRLALDTGARISYIDDRFTNGEPMVEMLDDFNPMIGNFSTPIYSIEATLGNQKLPVRFGNLPSVLAMPLKMMGLYGAIGYDLFNSFMVFMDFNNNRLLLKNND